MRRAFLAMVAGLALIGPPVSPTSTSTPLAITTDFAATRARMAAAGYGELARDRNFLAFDPSGDGRAVEVVGDLATADRIVVVVPGNDTTLRDFDRGLGGVARRAPAVQARALHEAIGRADVAVVAWLGYDPPEGLGLAAMRQERARAGARELRRFVGELSPHATVVVVGHSYGTVVMGLAAPGLGCAVTDLVALGSPGLGGDFRPGGATLWAATSESDWIRRVPGVRLAGFGHGPGPGAAAARPLPVDGVEGHDAYLVPNSSTLKAIARLVATGGIASPT